MTHRIAALVLPTLVACGPAVTPHAHEADGSHPAPAPAATPAAPHADDGHAHAAPHGGVVKAVGARHVEAVFMPGGVLFYLSDTAGAALPVEGFAGSVVVKGPAGVETVTLQPMGDHLHAVAKLEHAQPAGVVLTLTHEGRAESATFEVAAVGLAEHDHTSLHGGQVGMWRDFHLEYAPKDGEHRVYVTDAKRLPITGAVSGSLKDGDATVPLVFDPATGMLSGKAPGAGSRKVLVDVKVGETAFSLGFQPVAGTPAPHGEHAHGDGAHAH
jgi:hypothetical protein